MIKYIHLGICILKLYKTKRNVIGDSLTEEDNIKKLIIACSIVRPILPHTIKVPC